VASVGHCSVWPLLVVISREIERIWPKKRS
jgi:hypothetical protein